MAFFGAIAGGNIPPCRFVKEDTTTPGQVLVCGAGDQIFGVSQKGVRNPPFSDGNFNIDDGYAAIAGGQLNVYGPGEHGMEILVEAGGTITRRDRLKSGALGVALTTVTDKDEVGAIALRSGVLGDLIPVQLIFPAQISS
jgi:hypothetical protein